MLNRNGPHHRRKADTAGSQGSFKNVFTLSSRVQCNKNDSLRNDTMRQRNYEITGATEIFMQSVDSTRILSKS